MEYQKPTFTVPGPKVSQADWDRIFRKAVPSDAPATTGEPTPTPSRDG